MVLNCRSKRNPGISDTIQFVPDRIASISDIEFVSSKMRRDPRSPSMVLPRCMLSTVVRDICEPRSMALMLTQKQSDSRTRSSYSAYTDMLPECDDSMYQTR